jgi:hypothetical protein
MNGHNLKMNWSKSWKRRRKRRGPNVEGIKDGGRRKEGPNLGRGEGKGGGRMMKG